MATVSQGSKAERFGFIDRHRAELGSGYLCEWLKVSRQGYYKWCHRVESQRAKSDRLLLEKIKIIFNEHKTNYGSPRVHKALRDLGERVGKTRVERLMREHGLVGKAGRIYRRKARAAAVYMKLNNLRIDAPVPTSINQQWVADLTYLRVAGQWRYLAVVMDRYSRRILGWSLGKYKTAELVLASIKQALGKRTVRPGMIFHTDRGVEYGAGVVQAALTKRGIRPSMNRPGHVTDNAHIESFFQSMKTEIIREVSFESESDLRLALAEYLDIYYNQDRLHSSIGYRSPIECERLAAA